MKWIFRIILIGSGLLLLTLLAGLFWFIVIPVGLVALVWVMWPNAGAKVALSRYLDEEV